MEQLRGTPEGRVLTNIRHGGHYIVEPEEVAERRRDDDGALNATAMGEAVTFATPPAYHPIDDEDFYEGTTRFDYAFLDLMDDEGYADAHLPRTDPAAVVQGLLALGAAMVEQDQQDVTQNSPIPAIYTYWGQFIDHDLTANTDRDSDISDITPTDLEALDPEHVRTNLRNLRHPALNLDSVYGDGPTFSADARTGAADLYDGIKLRIGTVDTGPDIAGVLVPPVDDLARDLPRRDKTALIGDGRNDENLVVAQFHLSFLRFHNATVDWVRANEPAIADDDEAVFSRSRQLTEWTYQWLVANDYLTTVAKRGVVEDVLANGDGRFASRDGDVYMPLEFSTAAYRFGHSMVRGLYDYNRNFGKPGLNVAPNAPFFLLFLFTGDGGLGGSDTLPFNWVIEWDRFVDKGDLDVDHYARTIDTFLAPPLGQMTNQGNDVDPSLPQEEGDRISALLKHLAQRNLLRGYHLSIPTGQAVAAVMGVTPLAPEDLADEGSPLADALDTGGFREKTPLWYYVLREAQAQEAGRTLGELGSRLVCETIVGQVRHDPTSYLRQEETWTPDDGVRLPDGSAVTSITDFLRFAGVMT